MANPLLAGLLVAATLLPPHGQQDTVPTELRAAAAELELGRVDEAIKLAERYTLRHGRDPRGFMILGDAHAAHMPTGRFRALESYRQAKQLLPHDPEPPYRIALMGLWLGGDDGERIAREGLERVIELDPLYRDAWDQWLTLYRNAGGRRKMIERLQANTTDPVVQLRIAQLLIEEERYADADHLLDIGLTQDSTGPGWNALRAESALEAGDTLAGIVFYDRALRYAVRDSANVLWRQVVGIATPSELRAWWAGVPPEAKGTWLESFWARRNPNLFASTNHRIVEHFSRLRYARKHYPLLHPLVSYHRSSVARTLNLEPAQGEREFHLRCEVFKALPPYYSGGRVPLPGVSSVRDRARVATDPAAHLTTEEKESMPRNTRRGLEAMGVVLSPTLFVPLGMDLRGADTMAARVGYNLATGLDDRGIMYLRFGPPDASRLGGDNTVDPQCNTDELERWRYAEWGEVRFVRPSAFSKGLRTTPEMVFRPMNQDQFASMQLGLTRDASSEIAALEFGLWTAQFRNRQGAATTDLVIVSTSGALAAALVGDVGGEQASGESNAGSVTLAAAPGRYVLLAHAREGDTLGRQELGLTLRSFHAGPAISDLLLAKAWRGDTLISRSAMLEHVQRGLTFAAEDTVRVYAEVYGLRVSDERVSYHVTYRILRSDDLQRDIAREDWPGAIGLEFDRASGGAEGRSVTEMLDLSPQQIPRGSYLLRVQVWDNAAAAQIGRAMVAFRVR